MRRIFVKGVVVSALASLLVVAAPATQVFAWGGCCSWGGGYYNSQRYVQPVPQTYVAPQTTQPRAQSNINNFDPTVFDIQLVLFEQGYYDGDVDGLFGSKTKAALLRFQADNGIEQTTYADVVALKTDTVVLEALGLEVTGL